MISISKTVAFVVAFAALTVSVVLGQGDVCLVIGPPEYTPLLQNKCKQELSDAGTTGTTCTADYSTIPAYKAQQDLCANITDSTFRPQNVTRKCGANTIEAVNMPYCISQSCNQEYLSDYRTEVEKSINAVYKELGIDCEAKLEDSSAFSFNSRMFAVGVAAMAMLAL